MADPVTSSSIWLIGIDLGTTHTAVACCRIETLETEPEIDLFALDQMISPGEVVTLPLLPSVRYQSSLDELAQSNLQLPWPDRDVPAGYRPVLGELARRLGARTPGRLITSAKSWLSHPSADRSAEILPWGAPEGVPKVSPLEASAGLLRHVREAWDFRHPEAPLAEQELVVTVPASFDEGARALTVEAARLAGLPQLKLLEEPQAVCYDWVWRHRHQLQQELAETRLLLVVDIGGGTMDLTLIKVEPGMPEPRLTRIAVGNHLMLGGDNIDLALAHLVERRLLHGDGRLSAAELSQLVEQCRVSKERLLANDAPESVNVTLLGGGSRLIGSSRSVQLDRDEVQALALDGFFPRVPISALPDRKRAGIVEFGLPYVSDPGITRHVAAFLTEHCHVAQEAVGSDVAIPVPDTLLLNGGVFHSPLIVQRMLDQLTDWGGRTPRLLENDRPDLAVAYGAVAYGVARRGKIVQRIAGGASRSYFLRIATENDEKPRGVCILPRGTEEGHEIVLSERSFLLKLGVPVRFTLASARDDRCPLPGELVDLDEEHFQNLPPLAVVLDSAGYSNSVDQPVRLAASLSAIGTLELYCVADDETGQRWQVEFQLRRNKPPTALSAQDCPPQLMAAVDKIAQIFGKKTKSVDPKSVKGLRVELERLLGPRADWNTPVLRHLFAGLLEGAVHRRRSVDHERLWFNLAGFCLRPGFGYPLDDWRVEQIFSIYGQGVQFANESQNWAEWWTLWRRIAGGLDEASQLTIYKDLAPFINPETAKRGNGPMLARKRSYEDMIRLAAAMERLPAEVKTDLGGWLVERLGKAGEPSVSWWALGRIGSRVPLYASVHNVVPSHAVQRWLPMLLKSDFRKDTQAAFAATLLARMSGDRERDINDSLRQQVVDALRAGKAPESWLAMVSEVQVLSEADEQRIYGEALPPGIKLAS